MAALVTAKARHFETNHQKRQFRDGNTGLNTLLPEMFHKEQGFTRAAMSGRVVRVTNNQSRARFRGIPSTIDNYANRLLGKEVTENYDLAKSAAQERARGSVLNVQLIIQLLVLAGEAKAEAELVAQLESLLKAYGFDHYSLLLQPRPNQEPQGHVIAARWPDGWTETYTERKYALIDPTVRMLGIAQRPFRWRDAVMALRNDPHRQRMQRMMQESTRYGLLDGYTFPIHGRNGLLGNFSVGGRPVELSQAEMSLFGALAARIFWRFMELRGQAEELEAAAQVDTQLTRREMEVIALLTDGLTSNEIAKALDISSHTVDWYINGLQEKLKAKNRQHVVASAFRLGLAN